MPQALFTCWFVLCFFQATAQHTPDFKQVYHPAINQAELAIVDKSFHKALEHYQAAFAAVKTPFARDLFNALLCATSKKKYDIASRYAQQLMKKGASIEYFEKNDFLKKFRQTSHWQSIKKAYPNWRKAHLKSINQTYKQKLLKILDRDQLLRGKKDSYTAKGAEIRKLDRQNMVELHHLIQQYGFPSESRVGCGNSLDLTSTYVIPLVHFYQRMSLGDYLVDINFSEILSNAIATGEVAPHQVAYINGYTGVQLGTTVYFKALYIKGLNVRNSQSKAHQAIVAKAPWYKVPKVSKTKLKEISRERKALGLENLQSYQKKVRFALKNDSPFLLKFPDSTNIYYCSTPKDVAVFTAKAELLE